MPRADADLAEGDVPASSPPKASWTVRKGWRANSADCFSGFASIAGRPLDWPGVLLSAGDGLPEAGDGLSVGLPTERGGIGGNILLGRRIGQKARRA
jgi:hypothetical protein